MLSRDALFSHAFFKFFLNFVPAVTRNSVVREERWTLNAAQECRHSSRLEDSVFHVG